ncbi:MAG: DMT family transporter [Candidatus Bathyarchaeota archaeon]|nr:MAG: DMT family transporter [Candidatus Bathyarchaeota archaeon]
MTHHWGYVGAIASAVLFGVSSTLNKLALEDVNPLVVAGSVYFIGGLLLFGIHLSPLHKRLLTLFETPTETETVISKKDYRTLAFVVLFGSILAPVMLLYGLNETTAINASLLLNTESFFTVLIALAFLKERGLRKDYLAIILLLVGIVFLTTKGEFHKLTLSTEVTGNLLVVGACFSWGIDNNLSQFLSKKRDIVKVTGLKCSIGGTVLLSTAILLGISPRIPITSLPYIFSVGAFSIAFSILLFLFSLREIGSMRTGVVFSLSSMFGALFAFIVLREILSPIQLLAGLVMLIGVYILFRKPIPTQE